VDPLFDDLDLTLKKLLDDPAAPGQLRDADVSFETPGKDYAPGEATINLFLRGVHEDLALRDPVPIVERSDGGFLRREPPLRVECSYLVTTWAPTDQGGPVKVSAEHRLLGLALAWLRRFPTIPPAYLQGGLADQPIAPPTLLARPEGGRDVGEFWTALGIPPRPALDLSVTVSLDLAVAAAEGPPVTTATLRLVPEESIFQIGGTVRVAEGGPVPGARVALTPGGRATSTDQAGRFRFTGVAAGDYVLHTAAAGHDEALTAVVVPGNAPDAYDVSLPH
jgi:hypothetical protein